MFSSVWIVVFGTIVASGAYLSFGDVEYALVGVFVALPYFLVPFVWPFAEDLKIPFGQRYYVLANVWIAILSFVGNYFWTHYFYTVLGAAYSFPVSWMLNDVPVMLYFITHGYFMFYHVLTTIAIRWYNASPRYSLPGAALLVWAMAVVTAFMETFTISSVPFYSHQDKWSMYTVGSVFYGIYFYISFPMFARVGEEGNWDTTRAALDSLAACMLVTIGLDLWRIVLGGTRGLPWLSYL